MKTKENYDAEDSLLLFCIQYKVYYFIHSDAMGFYGHLFDRESNAGNVIVGTERFRLREDAVKALLDKSEKKAAR
ncbi:MAG: hypothetical protein QM504_01575 [Pseudomonadota bacterium]